MAANAQAEAVLLAWCERDYHVQHPRAGRDAKPKEEAMSSASSASCVMACDSTAPRQLPLPPPLPLPLPPAPDAHHKAAAAVDALLTAVHAQARESAPPVQAGPSAPWDIPGAAAAAGGRKDDDCEEGDDDDACEDDGEADAGGEYYPLPYAGADGRRSPPVVAECVHGGSPPSALVYVLCPPREALAAALVAAAAVLAAVAIAGLVRS